MAKKKKAARKKAAKKTKKTKPASAKSAKTQKPIGTVTHFYTHIKVAIVKFKKPVAVGASLRFKGATTDFEMTLKSMQYDHKPISRAPKNKQIGIKVSKRVREGDQVYSVER